MDRWLQTCTDAELLEHVRDEWGHSGDWSADAWRGWLLQAAGAEPEAPATKKCKPAEPKPPQDSRGGAAPSSDSAPVDAAKKKDLEVREAREKAKTAVHAVRACLQTLQRLAVEADWALSSWQDKEAEADE